MWQVGHTHEIALCLPHQLLSRAAAACLPLRTTARRRCTRACKASGPCAHTNETVCGGVRLCCARGRSDAVRNRVSSSLSRDCRGGVLQQCRLGCSLSSLIMLPWSRASCASSKMLPQRVCYAHPDAVRHRWYCNFDHQATPITCESRGLHPSPSPPLLFPCSRCCLRYVARCFCSITPRVAGCFCAPRWTSCNRCITFLR